MSESRPTILVVEDDEAIRDLLSATLTDAGYAVHACEDIEALRYARDEQPAVVLLDLMLPYLDGTAILGYLHRHPKTAHIPVIITSAVGHIEHAAAGLGAFATLGKPYALSAILGLVKSAVEGEHA